MHLDDLAPILLEPLALPDVLFDPERHLVRSETADFAEAQTLEACAPPRHEEPREVRFYESYRM